ncbi:MAG TPA: glycosyltransferase family 87 protein [Polyangia bacterium]|nr:glycosyltransferase family 87 protein [Polyangia bacterium]
MGRLTAALLVMWAVVVGNAVTFADRLRWPHAVASTDFSSYVTGWWMVLHGEARLLYDQAAQTAAQRVVMGGAPFDDGLMAFLYPPYVAVAGLPLGLAADRFGEPAAYALWTLANLAFAARLAWLASDELRAEGRARLLVWLWVFAFFPVLSNLALGQLSVPLALAAFELFRATRDQRPTRAALCLAVLAIKPQLLPPVGIWLIARRAWPALRRGAAAGAVLAIVPAIALGPRGWLEYFRHVHTLERFFAPGLPVNMVNLRGLMLRLAPAAEPRIDAVAYAVWALSLVGLALALSRRRGDAHDPDGRETYALAIGIALLGNPHLFNQEVALAVVPFALHLASLRARGLPWRPFALFVLAWPPAYALARLCDLTATARSPSRTPVDPVLVGLVLLLLALRQTIRPSAGSPTDPAPGRS